MTNTAKFKVTERYSFGWTSPYMKAYKLEPADMANDYTDTPSETLKDIWRVKFGDDWVRYGAIVENREYVWIGRELLQRKELLHEQLTGSFEHHYKCK